MEFLSLEFEYSNKMPLYRIVANAIHSAIQCGQLKSGQTLPSVRQLASMYNISPATVIRAYEQLASQSLVKTYAKSRTRIAPPVHTVSMPNETILPTGTSDQTLQLSHYAETIDQMDEPHHTAYLYHSCFDELPVNLWQKMLIRHRNSYHKLKTFSDLASNRFGYLPLREIIADYLLRARGIKCCAEQIIVTNSSRLDFFCRLLLNADDYVALENPTYPAARTIISSHKARIQTFPVDQKGLVVESLIESKTKYKLVHVSPSHNEPTGAMLSLARRKALVEWAQKENTIIWENDFDCHYRYASQPIPALAGLLENNVTFYSSSFWMSLRPLTSLGFLVIPKRYTSIFERAADLIHFDINPLEQCALADFIEEGHMERFLRRSNAVHAKRRQTLIHTMSTTFGKSICFSQESGSKHVLLQFKPNYSEQKIISAGNSSGLPIESTNPYYITSPVEGEFVIPFSLLDTESIPAKVSAFDCFLKQSP
jgi:GntR family transcriptional regulator/MocR family aminotransferase